MAIGTNALGTNDVGGQNTAIGTSALGQNTNGQANTGIGYGSLSSNIAGQKNAAIGWMALMAATGNNNTAIGSQAGRFITSGSNNIAIGNDSNVPTPAASDQMSIGNVIYGTTMSTAALGKIGIGEPAPNAKMQINASSQATPNNTDGILIPRINTFPIVNPGALQNGMMVFLTTVSGTSQPGFYYWDNASSTWKGTGSRTDGAFYEVGTVLQPDAITDNMYHTGNVAIGKNTTSYKLDVEETNGANLSVAKFKHTNPTNTVVSTDVIETEIASPPALASGVISGMTNVVTPGNGVAGYGVSNFLSGTSTNAVYGTSNNISTIGTGFRFGTTNVMSGTGTGAVVGTRNSMTNTSTAVETGVDNVFTGTNSGQHFGTTNSFAGSGNGLMHGTTNIFTTTGTGQRVGLYNVINNSSASNVTAGVVSDFQGVATNGRFGINNNFSGANATHEDIGMFNFFSTGTDNGKRIGVANYFGSNTIDLDDSEFYGVFNEVQHTRAGKKYGLYTRFYGTGNATMSANAYGTYTEFNNSMSASRYGHYVNDLGFGTGSKYGYYALIAPGGSIGSQYGIFTDVNSTYGFAAYFDGKTYGYDQQLTTNGDGQNTIYGYRDRNSQNNGSDYYMTTTNNAIAGNNHWGDQYTFGVAGFSDNDSNRTGGVLGGYTYLGGYWASLGYKNSGGTGYGIYASATGYAQGTGRAAAGHSLSSEYTIGGGFYGGIIGSWSKGNVIGNISSGSLFASYNSGDEYTSGKQIELVDTGNAKTAAYTVTSTEIVVYKKGKIALQNGSARVNFDAGYIGLLGDVPVVTTTPMGQCNGLYIESVDKTGFTIKEMNNGASNVSVSWIAVGDRVDAANSQISASILDKNFDANINETMFNENNKNESAKAIWSDGNTIQFGQLPKSLQPAMQKTDPEQKK